MPEDSSGRTPELGPARQVIGSVAVSGFGTWSYNVGIAVYAYERTHSASWVAVVTVGRYLPALVLSWLAHSFIERWPRRTVALAADLGCAAVMAMLALAAAWDAPLWLVTVFAAVSSTLARIQAASVLSLVADVVVESQLARAARLTGAAEAVATAVGSAAASAVLVSFSPPGLFVVNAATFVISASLIAAIRPPQRQRPSRTSPAPPVKAARETPGSLASVRVFWPLQAARGLAAYVYGVDIVILTVIASRQFHSLSGTSAYGWLLAATGLGGLIAITPMRRDAGRTQTANLLLVGLVIYTLPVLVFALDPPAAVGIGVQVLRGLGSVLVTSAAITGLQRSVPSSMAGQVFSTTQSLVLVGTCAGALCTPLLLGLTGFHTTLVISAVVPAVAGVALYPALSRFGRQEADLLPLLDPRLSVLRDLQLLRDASRSTLYEIADSVVELGVGPGALLVREGDVADALYVLVSGTVDVTVGGPDGPAFLRQLVAPDYFGEIGLLRGSPRTSTVTASEACVVWRVPGEVFLAAIAEAGASGALSDTVRVRFATRPTASADRSTTVTTG
jgi:MFS family permease